VSQLLHDHIVTVSDVGTDSEHALAFFVMELIEGRDLGSVLWREGPLAWTTVVEIGKQICGALEAAHARGIIHRDIKPANCMLLDGPEIDIKVLDFGIAKFTELYLEHRPELVWSETAHDLPTLGLVGTPGYVAPEQLERSADDPRVDIYGLGAMLYRLLTNKMPVPQEAGRSELPQPLANAVEQRQVPRRLAEVIVRALSIDPELRFASAAVLRGALDAFTVPGATTSPTLNVTYRKGLGHWVSRTLMLVVPFLMMVAGVKLLLPGKVSQPLVAQNGQELPGAKLPQVAPAVVSPVPAAAGVNTKPAPEPERPTQPEEPEKPLVESPKPSEPATKPHPASPSKKTPKQQLRALHSKVKRCFRDATKGGFPNPAEYVDIHYEISAERVQQFRVEGFKFTRMPDCLRAKVRKLRFEGVKEPEVVRIRYTVPASD